MAIRTGIGAGDVIGCFTLGNITVVTADAGSADVRMIYIGNRSPSGYTVAALADIGGLDVAIVLTGSRGAVMATRTVARYVGVVIGTGTPGDRVMAILALSAIGRDMVGRQTRGGNTIVAIVAGAYHGLMVDPADSCPAECGVTEITGVV